MNSRESNRQFPASNPLANVIVVIIGALVIGASIILGVFAFVALSGIILVLAAILGVRVWWLGRKRTRYMGTVNPGRESAPGDNTVIEGEFHVVSAHRDKSRQD